MTCIEWMESVPEGVDLITSDHHVFQYAKLVGLPEDMLGLAFEVFCDRYRNNARSRYIDWPKHFRNAVEANWYHLWFEDDGGTYQLTQAGRQAQRLRQALEQASVMTKDQTNAA